MNLFRKLFHPKTTEVKFEKVEGGKKAILENQDGRIEKFNHTEIMEYIHKIIDDNQQFVMLELPRANYGIRYVQACVNNGKISVELGIEEDGQTRLVEKSCDEEECRKIFLEFFDWGYVNDLEKYRPVEFFQ